MKNRDTRTRTEKLEFLLETCSSEFIVNCPFLQNLVQAMSDDEFDKCFNYICRNWDIARSYEEINEMMFA